jgi:hypothetical protein
LKSSQISKPAKQHANKGYTIERTNYFTLSSWADISVSDNAIESELQTEALAEGRTSHSKYEILGGIFEGSFSRSSYVFTSL